MRGCPQTTDFQISVRLTLPSIPNPSHFLPTFFTFTEITESSEPTLGYLFTLMPSLILFKLETPVFVFVLFFPLLLLLRERG